MGLNSDIVDWIKKIDPNKVYDVLVEKAGASSSEQDRAHFVSCWDQEWCEWRFCGNLGFGGKLWRERRGFPREGYVPHFRVSCYSEDDSSRRGKIIEETDKELLGLLVAAGLRKQQG